VCNLYADSQSCDLDCRFFETHALIGSPGGTPGGVTWTVTEAVAAGYLVTLVTHMLVIATSQAIV
jgi:hypothetical protein